MGEAKKRVFVVAAGASRDFGMPLGSGLITDIRKRIDFVRDERGMITRGHSYLWQCYVEAWKADAAETGNPGEQNLYREALGIMQDGLVLAKSIDAFIYAHRSNRRVARLARLAIASSLLAFEQRSTLYFNLRKGQKGIDFDLVDRVDRGEPPTWARHAALMLFDGPKETIAERLASSTFIVLNYDRCLQLYFYHFLRTYFRFSGPETAQLMKLLNVYHVYGRLGFLQWENQAPVVDFGADDVDPARVIKDAASQIRTYTEEAADTEVLDKIRAAVCASDVLVVLGAACHAETMQLLSLDAPGAASRSRTCYATGMGESSSRRASMREALFKLNPSQRFEQVEVVDTTCEKLLKEYSDLIMR